MPAREMQTTADRDPKDARRAVWAMGDYHRVSREVISGLGVALVEAAGVHRGQRVLDVAAGSGNASIPAAQTGASVVASDLTPELLERGRTDAAARGAQLEWVEADAEDLPFDDGHFDVVLSCVGAMFAPDHQRTADELLRVCRPGGTIALLSWTPEGSVGKFFATLAPFGPPPPPGALAPALWGDEDYVRELFSDRVAELDMRRDTLAWDFDDPADLVGYYKAHFGPVIATYEHVAADPDRVAELDRAFLDYAHHSNRGEPGGPAKFDLEYLLAVCRRR